MGIRDRVEDHIMRRFASGIPPKQRETILKVNRFVSGILWAVAKFFALVWIANRIMGRRGFEETVIVLLVFVIVWLQKIVRKR
ncbi:MAG TPA: hypothetical protein ENI23_15715 [bacterium]|nr:hypothetical protein [bacterium]